MYSTSIASDIKLVFHSSTITMMHGPINIRFTILLPSANIDSLLFFYLPVYSAMLSILRLVLLRQGGNLRIWELFLTNWFRGVFVCMLYILSGHVYFGIRSALLDRLPARSVNCCLTDDVSHHAPSLCTYFHLKQLSNSVFKGDVFQISCFYFAPLNFGGKLE